MDDKGLAGKVMAYTAAFSTDKNTAVRDEHSKGSHTCFKNRLSSNFLCILFTAFSLALSFSVSVCFS